MNQAVDNPGNEIKQALLAFKPVLMTVAVFTAVANILMLVPAIYMLQVYDRVLTSRNEYTLLMLTLLIVMLYVLLALIEWIRSQIVLKMSDGIDAQLNERVFTSAFSQSLKGSGVNAGQSITDFTNIRQFVTGPALFAFMDAPWFPVYLAVIFAFDWRLGVFATIGALILMLLAWANEKMTHKPLVESNTAANSASQLMTNQFRNSEVIESMGMLKSLYARWRTGHETSVTQQGQASTIASAVMSSSKGLRLAMQSGILGFGALLVIWGNITPGMMIAASILLGRALAPVDALIGVWKQVGSARSAYQRLVTLMNACPPKAAAMSLPKPMGKVSVRTAMAIPPNSRTPSLYGVSLELSPGDVLGIIGPSGSGKSSLGRLILGIWPSVQGSVRLDGADIFHWSKEELGPYLGYLPQDVELFAGTIAENIARFGELQSENIVAAAKLAGVHEMILEQPNGYETVLGEQGGGLSGGQRQRLGLARAVYGLPSLVVLDEPNSNLDDVGQMALSNAITKLRNMQSTVVVITHNKNILSATTHLALLKEGTLQSFGLTSDVMPGARAVREPLVPNGQLKSAESPSIESKGSN